MRVVRAPLNDEEGPISFQIMLTKEQKFLLANLVRENKDVLLKKFGSPGVTKKKKEEIWEYIRHELIGIEFRFNSYDKALFRNAYQMTHFIRVLLAPFKMSSTIVTNAQSFPKEMPVTISKGISDDTLMQHC